MFLVKILKLCYFDKGWENKFRDTVDFSEDMNK